MTLADAVAGSLDSIPWSALSVVLGFAVGWGGMKASQTSLDDKVKALGDAIKRLDHYGERLVKVETIVEQIVGRTIPAIEHEIGRQHESHKHSIQELRTEFYQRRNRDDSQG